MADLRGDFAAWLEGDSQHGHLVHQIAEQHDHLVHQIADQIAAAVLFYEAKAEAEVLKRKILLEKERLENERSRRDQQDNHP